MFRRFCFSRKFHFRGNEKTEPEYSLGIQIYSFKQGSAYRFYQLDNGKHHDIRLDLSTVNFSELLRGEGNDGGV